MKCSQCGGKRVDVRPNWKEQPTKLRLLTLEMLMDWSVGQLKKYSNAFLSAAGNREKGIRSCPRWLAGVGRPPGPVLGREHKPGLPSTGRISSLACRRG